ncbi:hypothetical protein C8D79_0242 [Bacteriovorax stolpii]|nr:hypothetical protein C8D79_0242 [Bacteriovorax stolpii]
MGIGSNAEAILFLYSDINPEFFNYFLKLFTIVKNGAP